MGDEADTRGGVIADPLEDLGRVEVRRVGVADWEVMRADRAFGMVSGAHTADIPVPPRPGGSAISSKPAVLGLRVQRNGTHAAYVG